MRPTIRGILAANRRGLAQGALVALGWQVVILAVPIALGWITTEAIERGRVEVAWWSAAIVIALAGAEAVLDGWRHKVENATAASSSAALRRSVLRGVLRSGRRGLDPGAVVARATDDTEVVGGLVDAFGYNLAYALCIPVVTVLLVRIDPVLAAGALAAILAGVAVVKVAARRYEERSEQYQEAAAAATVEVQAVLGSRRAVRGLGLAEPLVDRLSAHSREMARSARRLSALDLWVRPLGALASAAPTVVVLAWGGHRAATGVLALGELVTAIGLIWYVSGPIDAVVSQIIEVDVARASLRRIAEVADEDSASELSGPVGAGPVVLAHDPAFWSDTLRANLALGEPLDDDRLWQSLRTAEIHDAPWTDGLDTVLVEAGSHLSGGQRQRLAVARALLHADAIEAGDGLDGVGPGQRARLLSRVERHRRG